MDQKLFFKYLRGFTGFTDFELSFIFYLFIFVQNNLRDLETHTCIGGDYPVQ